MAAKSAAVCPVVDVLFKRKTGDHHPCCLCHALDGVIDERRRKLGALRVDARAAATNVTRRSNDERRAHRRLQSGVHSASSLSCFPSDATATLADGSAKPMRELQLGDAVLDATSLESVADILLYYCAPGRTPGKSPPIQPALCFSWGS